MSEHKSRRESESQVLKQFDKVFDDFNAGKIIKECMLKNCETLYKRLQLSYKEENK